MLIDCIRRTEDLDGLQQAWNQLNHLRGDNPFQSWEWIRSWWQVYGADRELFVLTFRDSGNQTVGIVPLCRQWSLTKGHCLELLGSGKACSDYQTFLVEPMFESDVLHHLVEWLMTADGDRRWDTLDLDGICLLDSTVNAWRTQMAQRAVSITQLEQPSCWRLELPPTWENYVTERARTRRRSLRKQLQTLQDSQSGVTYHVAESLQQAQEYLSCVEELHQRRWQEVGIQGCFASDGFRSFVQLAVERFWSQGELHLAVVRAGGEVVAGSLGIIRNRTHYVYLTGMNPQQAEMRPGWTLNTGHLSHAYQNGLTTIDYLRGDEGYKRELGATPLSQIRLRIASRQPWAQVRHRLWTMGRYCKRLTQQKTCPHQTREPEPSSHETAQ